MKRHTRSPLIAGIGQCKEEEAVLISSRRKR